MSEIQFPERHDYTPISPFKMFVKSNFPFIEATFESLDNYGLYCKVVEYLNQVIGETNDMASDVVAFTDFTTNYFENLDVQEEINNKLDEMALDGTLYSIMAPILQVEFVASTSNMTDHNRIYVLTTNNHIYQYTGSAFSDTGAIYSSVTNSLNINGTVITTSNYSELLPDLDGVNTNSIYHLMFSGSSYPASTPAHLPEKPEAKPCQLVTSLSTNTQAGFQIYRTTNNIYFRTKYNNTWSDWLNYENAFANTNMSLIQTSNYSTLLPDLNSVDKTGVYSLLFSSSSYPASTPAHLPVEPSGKIEMLYHKKLSQNSALQLYFCNSTIFYRYKFSNTWQDWINYTNAFADSNIQLIQTSNYETVMPDLDNVDKTGYYGFLFSKTSYPDNTPAHLPVEPSGKIEMLYHKTFTTARTAAFQIYYSSDNGIFMRWKFSGTWRPWFASTPNIIYCGTGEEFETLKSAIEYASARKNMVVYVKEGTYDLYEEYGGDDYFENYTGSTANIGLILKNNIHVIFSSNSKVVFDNSIENEYVANRFSVFNSGVGGFTLENCTIEGTNCRYLIHDERGSSTEQYKNVIKNCNFYHSGGFIQCIGGGLGRNGEIEIENCVFDSADATDDQSLLSYHNNNSATDDESKSNVIIKNNYFKKGTIRASWCGVSTLITDFLITNNYINSSIKHTAERETDLIHNTNVLQFNNYIPE